MNDHSIFVIAKTSPLLTHDRKRRYGSKNVRFRRHDIIPWYFLCSVFLFAFFFSSSLHHNHKLFVNLIVETWQANKNCYKHLNIRKMAFKNVVKNLRLCFGCSLMCVSNVACALLL